RPQRPADPAVAVAGRPRRDPAVGRDRGVRPAAQEGRTVSAGAELIRGAGLVKRFGGIVANDTVEFAVGEGDLIGLIGPNGSGKTTLINVLTGHLLPDGGEVVVRGRQMRAEPAHVFAAMGVARTFQL